MKTSVTHRLFHFAFRLLPDHSSRHGDGLRNLASAAACLFLVNSMLVPNTAKAQKVDTRLLADVTALHPAASFTLAVHLRIENGWYVYWRNPGDAGIPTEVRWELPPGFTADPLQWPAAAPHRDAGLVSYGYEREVVLFSRVRAPDTLGTDGDEVVFKAHVSWLVCQDICVPGDAHVELRLPVRAEADVTPSPDAALLQRFRGQVPMRSTGWEFTIGGRTLTLFPPPGFDAGAFRAGLFMALDPELTMHAGEQRWSSTFWGLREASLSVPLMPSPAPRATVRGVLIRREDDARGALDIEARRRE